MRSQMFYPNRRFEMWQVRMFVKQRTLPSANKGIRKEEVLGLTPSLELDILQKLYYLRKEIKCFRILFAC